MLVPSSRLGWLALSLILTASVAPAQRGENPPVLVPPNPQGSGQETGPPQQGNVPPPPPQPGLDASALLSAEDPRQPRSLPPSVQLPFSGGRKLVRVNGEYISTTELNQMAAYYQIYRPAPVDLNLRDAVRALIPAKVMEDRYRADLPAMRARIDEALQKIRDGASWEEVVAAYSDDAEAENPEGRYVFGRDRAVQPFDRFAHSGRVGQIHGPFLTQYGYHFLEILSYERDEDPKLDKSTVRHVLVMYPDLKKRDAAGEDIRAFIRGLAKSAELEALERATQNLITLL